MTSGRRITGVVLIALAVALALASIFVPWMYQERTVQDCTQGPCVNTDQQLWYGTTSLTVHGNQSNDFLYDDIEDRAALTGDNVPGLLSIELGFWILVGASATLGLGLVLALISLAAGRGLSIFASVMTILGAVALIAAMVAMVAGISAFSDETDEVGTDARVVEQGDLIAAFGVGMGGLGFFAALFGAILVPARPAPYEPPEQEGFYVPADEGEEDWTTGETEQETSDESSWYESGWTDAEPTADTGDGSADAGADDDPYGWGDSNADSEQDGAGEDTGATAHEDDDGWYADPEPEQRRGESEKE